jgi:predicted permease
MNKTILISNGPVSSDIFNETKLIIVIILSIFTFFSIIAFLYLYSKKKKETSNDTEKEKEIWRNAITLNDIYLEDLNKKRLTINPLVTDN